MKLITRRGTEEVHVTPIISGSDFRIVLAPAISVEKHVTVNSATVAEHIRVCGWSLEFNVVTDVDCFLNKKQVQRADVYTLFPLHVVCLAEGGGEVADECEDPPPHLDYSTFSLCVR